MRKQHEDDGIIRYNRLNPDEFDVVLGSHPGKIKPPRTEQKRSYTPMVLVALFVGMCGYLLAGKQQSPQVSGPAPVSSEAPVATLQAPTLPARAAEPAAQTMALRTTPSQNLAPAIADAMQPEPMPVQAVQVKAPPQGMVSASYMADFKADTQRRNNARPAQNVMVASATIREMDGHNRYNARWKVINNTIDNDSVCFNFQGSAGEHLQCRKAAQAFFKEECAQWGKRVSKDRDAGNKTSQQQYCTAAKTLNPAG